MKFAITGEVEVKEPGAKEPDEIAGAIQTAMAEMGFHFGPGLERVDVLGLTVSPVPSAD